MTFDDGLMSQFDHAFPLLQNHGLKATFFIVTGYIGYPAHVNESHLYEYAADGQEIGSHSYTHPFLSEMEPWEQDAELFQSQTILQNITGQDVTVFAYPYGDGWDDPYVVDLTNDYYIAARTANSDVLLTFE